MKKILLILSVLFAAQSFAQNAPSPEQFLGYKIGDRYTPHYKILEYFKAVADAKPSMVKIVKYGVTNENRDLEVAYIASPENLANIEEIRKNNLRLSGMLKDNVQPKTDGVPAIVWLSYNVHGNEPSPSEAAMMMLFALVDDNNTQTKSWLKNTVVIIDPCLNPDGRERYINWFDQMVGNVPNPDPQSREHNEPWPGGRVNHYNFDLNRDWAWQTQIETQQRLKLYNSWLPQVHADYHEQGVNEPYYFAPAAEPYHDVITQWQRDFQVMVGKNNAKYFDANGWLYFTKEEFDLFYPSYGDTYPIYNGSIGMTYEQAGNSSAGASDIIDDQDTLTLAARALHHFTTSMSLVEISSMNASRLVTEFKKFFDNNQNALGDDYKTYVLTAKDRNQLQAVATLLDKNGITYGSVSNNTFKGYNYFSGKEESYSDDGYNLAVTAFQPKSTLLKVLFEPKSNLKDSVTYDITAWSVPYAYGIKAYAVKDRLSIGAFKPASVVNSITSNYGYIIPYTSFNASEVLADLLAHHVKVRCAEKPFTYNNINYSYGTLIVMKASNVAGWNDLTNDACKKFGVQPVDVESGFMEKGADFGSDYIAYVHAPKVALVTGDGASETGAGEVWNLFEQVLHYPISLINANDLDDINLEKYTEVIIPNGHYSFFDDKNITQKLQSFVKNGGKIIAIDRAVAQMADGDWGIKLKEDKPNDKDTGSANYKLLKKYADRERDDIPNTIPGAIYKVEMDSTHPLAYGYPSFYYTLKQDANVYDFMKDGWNVGVIKQANYISGFVGSKVKPKLKDGLLFGVQNMGNGNIIYLADNPLFRLFWQNGKMLFSNAVFLVQ